MNTDVLLAVTAEQFHNKSNITWMKAVSWGEAHI